jgi:hypothetical protein
VAASEEKTVSEQSLLWGHAIALWDQVGIWSLAIGAVLGVAALLLTAASAYILYRVADKAQADLVIETKKSAERIAMLNKEAAKLQADNLALQTVLLPRSVGSIGINEPPKAVSWFNGMHEFAGTPVAIQSIDDAEARNLANEIAVVLTRFGLTATVETDRISPGYTIPDGVSYPIGKSWTADEPNQPWFRWAKAANLLADGLTKAGLAVGERPVSRYGFTPASSRQALSFKPVTEGLVVLVGARPVTETIQWIKQGQPNALGVKASEAEQPTK